MGVDAGLYVYDVVVKSSRSLSHLLMSSCLAYGSDGMLHAQRASSYRYIDALIYIAPINRKSHRTPVC